MSECMLYLVNMCIDDVHSIYRPYMYAQGHLTLLCYMFIVYRR